jgi:hypothetical protein
MKITERPLALEPSRYRFQIAEPFIGLHVEIDRWTYPNDGKRGKNAAVKGTYGKGILRGVVPITGHGRPDEPPHYVAVFEREDGELMVIPLRQIGFIKETK